MNKPAAPAAAPRRIFGLRMSAVIEAAILLAVLIGLDAAIGIGDRFFHVQPHPFGIVVLLVAAQYGLEEGLFAAAAASAALLVFNVPPPGPGDDVFAHATTLAFNPVVWTAAALLVGGFAERHIRRTAEMARHMTVLDAEADVLRDSVERLAQANESLEIRVAGQLATFASLYEAAKAVERETPGEVLIGAARLVRSALNAKEFSVFLLNEGVLEAALCEGWGRNAARARRFRAGSPLFDHVVARRAVAHVASPAGEVILGREGLLGGPILNPATGTVRGMLKIERMAFGDFTPAAVHNFRVLCDWLGAALARAEDLKRARDASLLVQGGMLLSRRLLSRFEDLLTRLAERESFPLAALDLDVTIRGEDGQAALPRLVSGATAEALRGTDLAFEGADGFGCSVLLPGAGEEEAQTAAARLRSALETRLAAARLDADVRVAIRLIAGGRNGGGESAREVA